MRKQLTAAILIMLLFAGLGSSALLTRALAQPHALTAIQQEKRIGPKPTPHWYWRWQVWRLGEGYAKGYAHQRNLRPGQAPRLIPSWAWRRLHFFELARLQRSLAASGQKHHGRPTTNTTTTTPTTSTTSTTTTTTPTTTTTASGGGTYDNAIAYAQTRPGFVPARVVDVASGSELRSAVANLQPGDLVRATADFTVTSSSTGAALVISKRLSAPAVIDLSGYSVKFVYSGGQQYSAVWLDNAENVRIYGGDTSTADTGGACIRVYGSQHVLWWGFTAHDCGGAGFGAQAIGGPVDHDDFQGTIWKIGQNLAWDPHAEKGSGLHGANLWDANYSGDFTNNRFAFDMHDIPTGACVEFGNDQPASQASGNILYLRCVNATFVSTQQTGGNGLQLWGDTNTLGLDVKYLEADNLQGYALFANGVYSGQTCTGVTVEHGHASNTNQNPRYNNKNPWDPTHGVTYRSAEPVPSGPR